jgi:hypothetical protein
MTNFNIVHLIISDGFKLIFSKDSKNYYYSMIELYISRNSANALFPRDLSNFLRNLSLPI